jgi:hypothetical protein
MTHDRLPLRRSELPLRRDKTEWHGQKGFTLIEVLISGLLLTFIVAALLNYHGSSGAGKNQQYYLKAVQVARAELEKLRALYEIDSGASEFQHTGPPPSLGLHHASGIGDGIVFEGSSGPTYHVYYTDHGMNETFLRPLWFRPIGGGADLPPPHPPLTTSGVSRYQDHYCATYQQFSDTDHKDRRTFTYFTSDNQPGYPPHSNGEKGDVDVSLTVIDDMGSPYDCSDDLLGGIGWWIEDVAVSGVTVCKKVTFVLAFRYPGQSSGQYPEVISLKTTLVKP